MFYVLLLQTPKLDCPFTGLSQRLHGHAPAGHMIALLYMPLNIQLNNIIQTIELTEYN